MSNTWCNADLGDATGERIPFVSTKARTPEWHVSSSVPETQQSVGRVAITELVNDGGEIDKPFPVRGVSSYWANMLP